MMITGAVAFILIAGLIGTYFVRQAPPNGYKVLESGIISEKEPPVMNLEKGEGIQNVTNETPSGNIRRAGDKEIQYANKKTEEEWIALAAEALNKYFDVDTSNLTSVFTPLPANDQYDFEETVVVSVSDNPDDVYNGNFYNVLFSAENGTIQEVYDIFSDTIGGKKEVATSVTVDEAKKMAEDFLINKELAKAENMEYIGGNITSEGRIHVAFNVDNKSIIMGIDTYTNEIKSFYIRSLDYANMRFSSPEDAVGR